MELAVFKDDMHIILSRYMQQNPESTSTQLFSFLALLNAYVPESYLLMSECQQILGPPDPIHGGPPFEERMMPFNIFINESSQKCMIHPHVAQISVQVLADLGISRSATVKKLMFSLCGDQPQPHILQFVKDLLTKRELGKKGQEKFSRLIEDIQEKEKFSNVVSVLKTASNKLRQNHIYPQTLSRLYYIRGGIDHYDDAEEWAKRAIEIAPNNSHAADTLGQIYKNRLMREASQQEDILHMAKKAFRAFKDVEKKADNEEGPEINDMVGTVSISNSFNNSGLFGFIQVAKIAFEKVSSPHLRFIQNLEMEVTAKFDFFERYLTYSNDMTSPEPHYFWKDIALCYEMYTTKAAAESRSFPGLLDGLNRGLFTSKGRRAGFEVAEQTVLDLEEIQEDLKTTYEANPDNVKAAESYILSNILLSNKMHNSPKLTPVSELQAIIRRFLDTDVGSRSPEFYLMALLLFWPEEEHQVVRDEDDEEVKQPATEDEGSEDETWEVEDSDEDQEPSREPEQLSPDLMFEPDLQRYVTFMEKVFGNSNAKYLRGRYLVPLFFLGKGSGLSRWIHKSRLDAIVENEVDAELAGEQDKSVKEKWRRINEKWIKGDVWRIPKVEDMLLPVRVEQCNTPTMPQEHEEEEVLVCAGGKKIKVRVGVEPESALSLMLFYLGFTIQGPVVFKVGQPHMDSD
ncbi:sterile alpha motif domain-containing protein 9-like [Cebidichthys violaceus]|uniref:sterile alpha motif domain-containing protein 9-like n=1 Tax=Cebidichthys violaceus TaxID=271503 RepID=UPI0035C99960